MKPAYVSVEFWRKDRDDTVTIEGWMTNEDPEYIFVSPSLDYDADVVKIAIPNDKVISITPAQSIREYGAKETPEIYRLGIEDGKTEYRNVDENRR